MNKYILSNNTELEKILLEKLPECVRDAYQRELSKQNRSYWQKISEARAIIIFNDLGISVKAVDVKTVNDKKKC
jgi:hypothetical protein